MEAQKNVFLNQNCYCSDRNGFYITKRQASATSATIIFLFALIFIAGYFWGQKKTAQDYINKVSNDAFADQVNYSMYSLYGENSNNDNDNDSESDSEEVEEKDAANNNDNFNKKENIQPVTNSLGPQKTLSGSNNAIYYAQLIGFGSKKSAEQFVNKIQKKGYNIKIDIVKRVSRSSNGKLITWFQAVTEQFSNKDDLIDKVEKIKLGERLNNIKIQTINN